MNKKYEKQNNLSKEEPYCPSCAIKPGTHGLIWHNIGRKAVSFLPVLTVPQILSFGFLNNLIS